MKNNFGTKLTKNLGLHFIALSSCLALGSVSNSSAVMVKGTGDPTYNTTPPTGALTNSGWQYQGLWGTVLGTVIGPHHFVAAQHVGGGIGQGFVFNGVT